MCENMEAFKTKMFTGGFTSGMRIQRFPKELRTLDAF